MSNVVAPILCAVLPVLRPVPLLAQTPEPTVPPTAQNEAPKIELLDHASLSAKLKAIQSAHTDRCRLDSIGNSRENREIWCLRIAQGEPKKAQPAILVVANLEGPQVFASAVALDLADRLASSTDEKTKALLADTTIYVIPRVDVDAAEARFKQPLFEQETTGRGVDNDRDGRVGEDEPSDVNGDGLVTWMRKLDPKGEWMPDPADPRAMVQADRTKGERGLYRLFREGRDSDHDDNAAEDPLHDTIVNQNFPYGWKEHDVHAGLFATDEPEALALCDFVADHKDLAMVVSFDALDTLVEKPKTASNGRSLPTGWIDSDANWLGEVQKRYAEATGNKTKGTSSDAGSFQGWAYQYRGLWALCARLWDIPLDTPKADAPKGEAAKTDAPKSDAKTDDAKAGDAKTGDAKPAAEKPDAPKTDAPAKPEQKSEPKSDAKDKREPSDDAKRLRWIDQNGESSRFVPWTAFKHPELGDVEIGGFAPFARTEPPEKLRDEIARKHFEFVVGLGSLLPRVRIAECTAKVLEPKLFEIKLAVVNDGFLPLESAAAIRNSAVRPVRVELKLKNGAILAGKTRELLRELDGSGARHEFRWLLRAADLQSVTFTLDSDNAGVAEVHPEVKS